MIDRYNNFYRERSASREKKAPLNQLQNIDAIVNNKENKNANNRQK